MSIELCQSRASPSVMYAKTPRLAASLMNQGSGAWMITMTGHAASLTYPFNQLKRMLQLSPPSPGARVRSL